MANRLLFAFSFVCLNTTLALLPTAGADVDLAFKEERDSNPRNPLSSGLNGLPFPSSHYCYEDSTSPTGKRVYVPDGVLNDVAIFERFSAKLRPSRIMRSLTGFSALTSILFEVPGSVDSSTLPVDGGETMVVFDRTTGERLDVHVELSPLALKQDPDAEGKIVQVYPRGRWAFGHEIVAVMTSSLRHGNGAPVAATPGVVSAINGGAPRYRAVLRFINQQGISNDRIISFTDFRIRDFESVAGPMAAMLKKVEAQEHAIEIESVTHSRFGAMAFLAPRLAARIDGRVQLSDFRNKEDGSIEYGSRAEPDSCWADFILYLPESANRGSVPLVIYGHGLGAFKSTAMGTMGRLNSSRGVATLAIDHPYHGSRADEGSMLNMFFQEKYTEICGAVGQSAFDLFSLSLALKRHLSRIDVLPKARNASEPAGDGIPDIDMNRIAYGGTSLGSLFGTSFAALSPMIKGAYMELAGGNIGLTLGKTALVLGRNGFLPSDMSPCDAALLLNIVLHRIDYADGMNYAQNFARSGAASGAGGKSLVLLAGVGDRIVANEGAYSLASVAGLPRVAIPGMRRLPETEASAGLLGECVDGLVDGSGLVQVPSVFPSWLRSTGMRDLHALLSHTSALLTNARIRSYNAWLDAVFFSEEVAR